MRTYLRGKITLLFMTLGLLLAIPTIALADNVVNDVAVSIDPNDAGKKVLSVQAGQKSSQVAYRISATAGDTGDTGGPTGERCNLVHSGSESLSISGLPSGVTVENPVYGDTISAPHFTFSQCGFDQFVRFNVGSSVAAGDYNITVTDIANVSPDPGTSDGYNENPAAFILRVTAASDTTAPDPPSTPDLDAASDSGSSDTDNVTNDNKPDFSGTAEANSTVELFAGATSLGTTTADASGNWSFDGDSILTSALADDTYSITAKATDASNNTSGASGALSVRIDTVANAPTGLDLTTDTGSDSTDDVTKDNTPTIDGSAEANGSVELFEGTTSLGTGSANNSGAWSITSSILSDGQHTLKTQVTDVAGNVSALSSGLVVTIDTVNPVVSFVDASAFNSNPSFDFGSVPSAPTCSATDTGGSGVDGTCQVGGYGTAVGNYTLTATANDIAGNSGSATPLTYSVLAAKANGFYQPVDMGGTLNTVKSGSTVPVKFELFGGASNLEQKTTGAVGSMSAKQVSCSAFTGAATDTIEYLAPTSENTGLRFDLTGDQFIYNWKTPKQVGCYNLTMTAADKTTTLVAYFQLK